MICLFKRLYIFFKRAVIYIALFLWFGMRETASIAIGIFTTGVRKPKKYRQAYPCSCLTNTTHVVCNDGSWDANQGDAFLPNTYRVVTDFSLLLAFSLSLNGLKLLLGFIFSEEAFLPTFFLDKKSCKKIKASANRLKIWFSSANEIVRAHGIAKL